MVGDLTSAFELLVGDLTSAFEFENPDYDWPRLPHTRRYVVEGDFQFKNLPPPPPPLPSLAVPVRPVGRFYAETRDRHERRVSRPLPYEFLMCDAVLLLQGKILLRLSIYP